MEAAEVRFNVIDDSGLLGLVDLANYPSFVSEDWTYESLLSHFADQMIRRTMLVWDCGDGGDNYRIEVRRKIGSERGFREALGGMIASENRLYVVSYGALTMAAQFADEILPSKHEAEFSVPVEPGPYRVRIVQMFEPSRVNETSGPDFLIEIEPGTAPHWQTVQWLRA